MKEKISYATHYGNLPLAGASLSVAVLEDKTRVISERSLAKAFGVRGGGVYWEKKKALAKKNEVILPEYLSANYLQPFITNEIKDKFKESITYLSKSKVTSNGIDASVLPEICGIFIDAAKKSANPKIQALGENAYILLKSFAKVGIIALIDEVTGYQTIRDRDDLRLFLSKFLKEEKGKWVKTFDDDFFEAIFKMKGWDWSIANKGKKPQVVGHYINNYVYSRLAPKILTELRKLNPKDQDTKKRKGKYPQWIDIDFGHPKLKEHITVLTAFAKAAGYNWNGWNRMIERALPKFNDDGTQSLELGFPEDEN